MRRLLRYIAAAVVFAVTGYVLLAWTWIGRNRIQEQADGVAREVPLSQAVGPRPDSFDDSAQFYYIVVIVALVVAGALAAVLWTLLPRSTFRSRVAAYLGMLIVLLPLNFMNYTQGDTVMPGIHQWGLDVVTIFAGSCAIAWLWELPAKAMDLRILKFMLIALLAFGAVAVPAVFTVAYTLWAAGVAERNAVEWSQITGGGALISAGVACLNLRRESRKDQRQAAADTSTAAAAPPSKIIMP